MATVLHLTVRMQGGEILATRYDVYREDGESLSRIQSSSLSTKRKWILEALRSLMRALLGGR